MEPPVAPRAERVKRLAAISAGAIVLGLTLGLPAAGVWEALSTATARGWPGPPADRDAQTSIHEALITAWFWAIPFLLLAALGAVGAAAWARGAGLPRILTAMSSFLLVLGIGAALGALLT